MIINENLKTYNKKIAILLPGIPMSPIGGYKVVYEYANRLVQDGFDKIYTI